MTLRPFVLLVLFCFIGSSRSWGGSEGSALNDRLVSHHCELSKDPLTQNVWPNLCLQFKANGQLLFRDNTNGDNISYAGASGYAGVHLHEYLSLHLAGQARKLYALSGDGRRLDATTKTDAAFIQFGNIALSKVRLAAGRVDIPFGINYRPLMEIYDVWVKQSRYWRMPYYGAKFTWDNLRETQVDIGYAADQIPYRHAHENSSIYDSSTRVASIRVMADLSDLEGTRFVFSGLGSSKGRRQFGAGLISVTNRGDGGAFEWVRSYPPEDDEEADFNQMFRFGYAEQFHSNTRWIFEYEDENDVYRLVTAGHDFLIPEYAVYRLAASYYFNQAAGGHSYWFIVSGVQIAL